MNDSMLPPGFELDPEPAASPAPAASSSLPPGFELDPDPPATPPGTPRSGPVPNQRKIIRFGRQVWPPKWMEEPGGAAKLEELTRKEPAPAPAAPAKPDTGMNVPESPATLQAQQQSVTEGRRPAVMYPEGTEEPPLPPGMARTRTRRGIFHYDPMQVAPQNIRKLSNAGRENEILGLGPFSKDQVQERVAQGEPPLAVTERQPDGTEVKAAVGTPSTAPAQAAAIAAGAAPGNGVGIEPMEKVVAERAPNGVPLPPQRPENLTQRVKDFRNFKQGLEPSAAGGILDDPGRFRAGTPRGYDPVTHEPANDTQHGMLTGEEAWNEHQAKVRAAQADWDVQRARYQAVRQRADLVKGMGPARRGSQTEIQRKTILAELENASEALRMSEAAYRAAESKPPPTMTAGRSATEKFNAGVITFIPKTIEGTALYAETILGAPSIVSKSMRDFTDTIERELSGDPQRREEILDKLGAGGGSAVGYLMGGALARGAGMTAKTAAGYLGATSNAADSYREAEAKGQKGYQLGLAYLAGAGIGATEMYGIGSTLDRLDKSTGGGVKRYFTIIMREAGEEGVQEATQQLLENVKKWGLFNEQLDLTKEVGENALVGALLGFGMSATLGAGALRRTRGAEGEIDAAGGVRSAEPFDAAAFEQMIRGGMEGARERNTTTVAPETPGVVPPSVERGIRPAPTPTAPEAPAIPPESIAAPPEAPTATPPSDVAALPPGFELDQAEEPAQPATIMRDDQRQALNEIGYDDEVLSGMSPPQVQSALEEARDAGYYSGDTALPPQVPDMTGRRNRPARVTAPDQIAPASDIVNTTPSDAQKAAGNYQKFHMNYDAGDGVRLKAAIETPKGSTRTGTDADGESWEVPNFPAHYGYIKGASGADGDQLDVFFGDKPPNGRAYVIDQYDPKTGKFDEHKGFVGVDSAEEAAQIYYASYPGGPRSRLGDITEMPIAEFKEKIDKGQFKKKKAIGKKPAPQEPSAIDKAAENIVRTVLVGELRHRKIDIDALPEGAIDATVKKYFSQPYSPELLGKITDSLIEETKAPTRGSRYPYDRPNLRNGKPPLDDVTQYGMGIKNLRNKGNVPDWHTSVQGMLEELAERLDFKTRPVLYVYSESRAEGLTSPKDGWIAVRDDFTAEQAATVALHEFGHQVEHQRFKSAPQSVRDEILAEYEAFKKAKRGALKFGNGVSNKALQFAPNMIDRIADGNVNLAEFTQRTTFSEWFAEQAARWLTTDARPISAVDRFFRNIANVWKKIYSTFTHYFPDAPSIDKFMSSIWEDEVGDRPTDERYQQVDSLVKSIDNYLRAKDVPTEGIPYELVRGAAEKMLDEGLSVGDAFEATARELTQEPQDNATAEGDSAAGAEAPATSTEAAPDQGAGPVAAEPGRGEPAAEGDAGRDQEADSTRDGGEGSSGVGAVSQDGPGARSDETTSEGAEDNAADAGEPTPAAAVEQARVDDLFRSKEYRAARKKFDDAAEKGRRWIHPHRESQVAMEFTRGYIEGKYNRTPDESLLKFDDKQPGTPFDPASAYAEGWHFAKTGELKVIRQSEARAAVMGEEKAAETKGMSEEDIADLVARELGEGWESYLDEDNDRVFIYPVGKELGKPIENDRAAIETAVKERAKPPADDSQDEFDAAFDNAVYGGKKPAAPKKAKAPKKAAAPAPKSDELPDGFTVSVVRTLTNKQAKDANRPAGTIKAVISRETPFGAWDGYGATQEEAIADAYRRVSAGEKADQTVRTGWRKIGVNAAGNPVYQDERNVRSYVENGIRVSETVAIAPDGTISRTGAIGSDFIPVEAPKAPALSEAAGNRLIVKHFGATQGDALIDALGPFVRGEVDAKRAREMLMEVVEDLVDADQLKASKENVLRMFNALAQELQPKKPAPKAPAPKSDADAAIDKLLDIFGGKKLQPMAAEASRETDPAIWDQVRPIFITAVSKYADGQKDVAGLVGALVAEMRARGLDNDGLERMRPYARRFVSEVRSGAIDLAENGDGQGSGGLDQPGEQPDKPDVADGEQGGKGSSGALEDAPAENGDGAGPGNGGTAGTGSIRKGARGGRKGSARGNDDAGREGASGEGVAPDGTGDRGSVPAPGRPNYHIADPERLVGGGPKSRFAKNRAALEAYRAITEENRDPTQEELDAIASYIGWGSFGQELFQGSWGHPQPKENWKEEDIWLRQHLGKDEWESAQRSIINAHYTDPPTVKAMWDMVRQMGFTGGRVLEPSVGIGNFFGMMPRDLMDRSNLTGIELDAVTGGMAKLLYPQANIQIKGYEQSKTPDNFYDVVIGNWPFADIVPPDRRYSKLSPNLHDYFFVKALDQTRPGGIVIGITSAGTMDKVNKQVRAHLAENAELIAAFRLPSGAFEKYAGTSVVTDIIILRKREKPIVGASQSGWYDTPMKETPAGTDIRVNEYYVTNPGNVLGRLNFGSGSTYGRPSMIVDRPDNLMELLEQLPQRLPADAYVPIVRGKEPRFISNNLKDRDGSITFTAPRTDHETVQADDKGPFIVQGERLVRLEDIAKYKVKDRFATMNREDQLSRLVEIRKAYGDLIDAEREGAADTEAKRKVLHDAYHRFRAKHGSINDSEGIQIFRRVKDPYEGSLRALERPDGTPAKILTESTTRAIKKLEKPTIRDAFVLSRNEGRNVNLERVAELTGKSVDEAARELLESKAIYRTPGNAFEVADVYLSGNVRRKLREAEAALAEGEDMQASIDALKEVIPKDIPYFNIEAQFGALWVRNEDYKQFIAEMLGVQDVSEIDIRFSAGSWRVIFHDKGYNRRPEATTQWGHDRYRFNKLLTAALNNMSVQIRDYTKDGPQLNPQATKEVAEKMQRIREHFTEWVWKDPQRRGDLEKAYNETMNAIATPRYDGSFLEFPGMALQRGDDAFSLRSHQANAIWRGLANQRGLYAHEVGTGKTYTMGGIAIESRRYGIARKPMIWAHNANSASVAAEIQQMYPGADILYIDNLSPENMPTMMRRIATESWDAIVMPHSLVDRISMREETLMEMAQEQILALEQEAREAANEDGDSLDNIDLDDEESIKKIRSHTAKDLVKQRLKIIANIKKMAQDASKENAIPFEELGVDMVIIDEVHEFKKPPIATKSSMKGLNKGTSSKSIQINFITNYVKKINGGKGIHIFTGTPITNTLVEIYNMQRYVMSDQMALDGVDSWDPWAATFAAPTADVEMTATGEYEPVTRLASFVNVAELRRMIGQYMDIVFADDMPEFKPRSTKSGKTIKSPDLTDAEREELTNGRSENPVGRPYKQVISDVAEMSPAQKTIFEHLAKLSKEFKNMAPKERKNEILSGGERAPLRVETTATNASLDARLADMNTPDHKESKVNRVVRRVKNHYGEHPKSTQVIFVEIGYTDSSTKSVRDSAGNKSKVKVERFNLVNDMVEKLVEQGIPRKEIAVVDGSVSKQKRKEIADKMNRAEIRVAIGNSATLGVGVNMQENLRAMHHMDAPWMPGLLEQRNGRGHRQGNKWNTVFEYRYITEKIDGRRWQVLAVKDRFIKAFLKADETIRVIDGDAVDMSNDEGSNGDISETLADAAGDSRILMREKLRQDIKKLENRERLHAHGVIDARDRANQIDRDIGTYYQPKLDNWLDDADHYEALRNEEKFEASVAGKVYDNRKDAQAAIDDYVKNNPPIDISWQPTPIKVQGFQFFQKKNAGMGTSSGAYWDMKRSGEYELSGPSVASAESTARGIRKKAEDRKVQIADMKESAARLREAMKQPFQQAAILDKKRELLNEIEEDLQRNPAPPPAWLRNGAPVDTLIYVNDQERVVTGHRWTNDGYFIVTNEGPVPYLDAKDSQGLDIFTPQTFVAPVQPAAKQQAPQQPQPMTATASGITQKAADAGIDRALVEEISRRAVEQILGPLAEQVDLQVRDELKVPNSDWPALGLYHFNLGKSLIEISLDTQAQGQVPETAAHEVFHYMQNHGFFPARDVALMERELPRLRAFARTLYGDMADQWGLTELTAVAFGRYYHAAMRNQMQSAPPVHVRIRRIFDALMRVMRRLQNWIAGLGFRTSEDIFENVRSGKQVRNLVDRYIQSGEAAIGPNMFSREQLAQAGIEAAPMASTLRRAPDKRSIMSHVVESVADHFTRIRELQRKYEADTGRKPADVHGALGSLNTRIAEKIVNFELDEMSPAMELVKAAGGIDRVSLYMYWQHAPERDAYIASINPMMPTDGSGYSEAETRARREGRWEDFTIAPDRAMLDAAASSIRAINDADLDRREAAGLLTPAQANAYRTMFSYYVPLRGKAGDEWLDDDGNGSSGVAVIGAESRHTLGRHSEADDIVSQSISKAINGIVRIEKNRVDIRLGTLARQMEAAYGVDSPMKFIAQPPMTQTSTVPVMLRRETPAEFSGRADVIPFKIGGQQRWVEFTGQNALVDNLRNAHFEKMNPVTRFMMAITQFYSKMRTAWNPLFPPINFIRDNEDALIAATAYIPQGKRAYAMQLPNAMRASAAYVFAGQREPEFEAFRARGGKMGFGRLRTLEQIRADAKRKVEGVMPIQRPFILMKHMVENWNDFFENAVRFALYKAALSRGMTVDAAVKVALEGTLNFHRRGAHTQQFRAIVPFLNPSIQSPLRAARMIRDAGGLHTATGRTAIAVGTFRAIRKTYALVAVAGFFISMWNYLMGGEDDDGEKFWDKAQADWRDEKNMLIYTGGKDARGKPNAIVVPAFPEIMFPYKIGAGMAAAIFGKRPLLDTAKDIGKAAYGMSPTEGRGLFSSGRFFIPQPFGMMTDLHNNRTWLDRRIHPEPIGKQVGSPKHLVHFPSTEQLFVDMARSLHKAGINMHPEDIRFVARELMGGLYQPVDWAASKDRPLPLLGKLYAGGSELHRKWEDDRLAKARGAANTRETQFRYDRKNGTGGAAPPGIVFGPKGGVGTPDGNALAEMNRQIRPLYERLNVARKAGQTDQVRALQGQIDDIKKRGRIQAESLAPRR